VIRIEGLLKTYTRAGESVVACDVDRLEVQDGEQVALVGPSGCGKTTLLHLVSGLLLPDRGLVEVDGQRVPELSERRRDVFRARNVGYVHQTFQLLAPFSALENVQLAVLFGRGTGAQPLDPQQLLERVGSASGCIIVRANSPWGSSSALRLRARSSISRDSCSPTSPWGTRTS
jgi:ABC-type lipoprotein export system ATPase subunit